MYTKYFGHMTKMTATPIYGPWPIELIFHMKTPYDS